MLVNAVVEKHVAVEIVRKIHTEVDRIVAMHQPQLQLQQRVNVVSIQMGNVFHAVQLIKYGIAQEMSVFQMFPHQSV
jgi:hypothetical protein